MSFDSDKEKKLEAFLKKNNPIPPDAKLGEYQRILRALENNKSSWWKNISEFFWPSLKWLVPVGTAAILTFIFWTAPFSKYDPEVEQALAMMMGPYPSEINGDLEEDWLSLAEMVSQQDRI